MGAECSAAPKPLLSLAVVPFDVVITQEDLKESKQ
jgi:hypothetical protein